MPIASREIPIFVRLYYDFCDGLFQADQRQVAGGVRHRGKSYSKRFETKREARHWAAQKEQALGMQPAGSLGHTLGQAMQRYAEEVSPARKGARWERVRLEKLRRDEIAHIMLVDLKREHLQDWIARQTISPASIHRELNLISAVLRECRTTWRLMTHNPMTDLRKPKKGRGRERIISDAERSNILVALDDYRDGPPRTARHEVAIAFLLALETAMRQGEI